MATRIGNSEASALFAAKISSSGLTSANAESLRIKLVSTPDQNFAIETQKPYIRIEYLDTNRNPTGFYRIRLLYPPLTLAAQANKQLRYLQPPNTLPGVYLPALVDWRKLISDPTQPLIITEGELKAACAAKHKYPCIGLGGVYGWRSAKANLELLPQLEQFNWQGRQVTLIFDSDTQTNFEVMRALHHLAKILTQHGARPRLAQLPGAVGEKVGLDDFIMHSGTVALDKIIAEARPFAGAEALWNLNERVCFVRGSGVVVELATGLCMTPTAFAREVYAPDSYNEQVVTDNNIKMVRKQTAVEWVKWPHRQEASCFTYAPGEARFTRSGELNTWKPNNITPKRGDTKLFDELLEVVFADDHQARSWFVQWCAYPFQHPGTKLLSAVVLWGTVQGTGKSLLGYTLARLYGYHNVSEITQDHLRSPFNDWLVDKQLILGEEITGSDRRADADRLKALITAKVVRVNVKHMREYQVPALANLFFTSNHPDAFFLEDTDRRFFVHEVKADPRTLDFYKKYVKWYESEAGGAALLDRMLTTDLKDFDPDGPAPLTVGKQEMIDDNRSDLGAWVRRLVREPAAVLAECKMPSHTELLNTTQLLALYDPLQKTRVTVNGLGRELKRARIPRRTGCNIIAKGVRTSVSLYAITNAAKWSKQDNRAWGAAWCKVFG